MKIYFLEEEALETLKGNINTNLKNYTKPNNEWIKEYFDGQSPFIEYKKEINKFELDMSCERPQDSDIENVKRIYTAMSMLSETEATDERLWVGLSHGIFWEYCIYRWSYDTKTPTENEIKSRFFFSQNKRSAILINSLAKLWWIGKLTYDENRSNPFELTEYLRNDFGTKVMILFSSNFSNNPTITRAFLASCIRFQKQDIKLSRAIYTETVKYINVLGGTYILDYFTEEELTEKITKRIWGLLYKEKSS